MFETIFTTLSGEKEIYTWNRVDDAVYHMNLFTEDDADLYQSKRGRVRMESWTA